MCRDLEVRIRRQPALHTGRSFDFFVGSDVLTLEFKVGRMVGRGEGGGQDLEGGGRVILFLIEGFMDAWNSGIPDFWRLQGGLEEFWGKGVYVVLVVWTYEDVGCWFSKGFGADFQGLQ